jgi:hypothetical protein
MLMIISKVNKNKDKFRRKHIVKVIFRKKVCNKDDIVLPLSMINPLPESLKLVLSFMIHNFLLITRWRLQF